MHTYPTRGLPAITAEAAHASRGYPHETGFCTVLEIPTSLEAPKTFSTLETKSGGSKEACCSNPQKKTLIKCSSAGRMVDQRGPVAPTPRRKPWIKCLSWGAGDAAQLAECSPGIHETLAFPAPHNPGMVAQASTPALER